MITVISFHGNCPWCVKAVELARANGYEVTLSKLPDSVLVALYGRHYSVPHVYVDDIHIGGYSEFLKFVQLQRRK